MEVSNIYFFEKYNAHLDISINVFTLMLKKNSKGHEKYFVDVHKAAKNIKENHFN